MNNAEAIVTCVISLGQMTLFAFIVWIALKD